MNRQWWAVGTVIALILALVSLGWVFRNQFAPVEVGSRAPSFSARTLAGAPVELSDLSGKVVLLNIWATWCPPCIEEMPSMQRLHEGIEHRDFEIVAVSIDASIGRLGPGGLAGGNVAEFVKDHELQFSIWRDPEGAVQRIYRATAVPESFLIDRNGSIVKKVLGATDWDSAANRDLVRRLLDSPGT